MNRCALIQIFIFNIIQINASDYESLNYWYHPHSVSTVGALSLSVSAESDRLNPAYIYNNEKIMNLSVVQYPSEITSQMAQVFYPKKKYVLGASIRHISYGIFEGYNDEGIFTSNYSAADTWFTISAAKSYLSEKIQVGGSAGYFNSNIGSFSAALFTGTIGVSLNIPKQNMNIGIAVRNISIEIKSFSPNKNDIPFLINFSTSKKLAYLPLSISINSDFDIQNKLKNFRIAGDVRVSDNINCRIGTSINRLDQTTNLNFFKGLFTDTGLGFTISTKQYVVDLGTYYYGMGGVIFAMGLGLKI